MGLPKIFTIGVYGSSEKEFFQKLVDNKIDSFCDIRRRRAVRGAEYAFVNSNRLQEKLASLSIKYIHQAGLAPTDEIRLIQKKEDAKNKVQQRKRDELSPAFKKAYIDKILTKFDLDNFLKQLSEEGTERMVLFCVEKSAEACHRSLVTERITESHPSLKIVHL